MPIYEYAPTSGQCSQCNGLFAIYQRIADDKLTTCPTCAQPCERRISAVALGGKYATNETAVKNSGLTQYKRVEKGVYERTVGTEGPEILHRN